jgi:hypothetical protein
MNAMRFTKEQSATYGNYLSTIRATRGRLDEEILIEVARETGSPLHDIFDWDDTVAAGKWRFNQAQDILRNVMIVVPTDDGPTDIRLFIRSQDDGYISLPEAPTSLFERELTNAQRDVVAAERRIGALLVMMKPTANSATLRKVTSSRKHVAIAARQLSAI